METGTTLHYLKTFWTTVMLFQFDAYKRTGRIKTRLYTAIVSSAQLQKSKSLPVTVNVYSEKKCKFERVC